MKRLVKIVVSYSDETTETFNSFAEAIDGIEETVLGCDFSATPVKVVGTQEDGVKVELGCSWRLKLVDLINNSSPVV